MCFFCIADAMSRNKGRHYEETLDENDDDSLDEENVYPFNWLEYEDSGKEEVVEKRNRKAVKSDAAAAPTELWDGFIVNSFPKNYKGTQPLVLLNQDTVEVSNRQRHLFNVLRRELLFKRFSTYLQQSFRRYLAQKYL